MSTETYYSAWDLILQDASKDFNTGACMFFNEYQIYAFLFYVRQCAITGKCELHLDSPTTSVYKDIEIPSKVSISVPHLRHASAS